MSWLKGFVLFWYRFLIGDDLLGAAIVLFGVAATIGMLNRGVDAFWLLPAVVLVSLSVSLYRLARQRLEKDGRPA